MNDIQRRNQERYERVRDFCDSRSEPFPADSRGGRALAKVKEAIQKSEELDAARHTHQRTAQQGTTQRKEAREQLHALIKAIAATARSIGLEHAEIRDKFRLTNSRFNDRDLLSLARSFRTAAPAFKLLFLEYDMPADFLETLDAGVVRFEQAIDQQNTGSGGRTQARAGIDDVQEEAARQVAVLDTIIRNKYRDDPATLAAWESASRLERAPQKGRKQNEQGNTPPANP